MYRIMEFTVVAGLIAVVCITVGLFLSRHRHTPPLPQVLAEGSLLVVDAGNVVINEPLQHIHGLLDDPEKYVTVEFDPNEPSVPPCAGSEADDLDWELTFKHRHDEDSGECIDDLHLKITWQVSSARTIIWHFTKPAKKDH